MVTELPQFAERRSSGERVKMLERCEICSGCVCGGAGGCIMLSTSPSCILFLRSHCWFHSTSRRSNQIDRSFCSGHLKLNIQYTEQGTGPRSDTGIMITMVTKMARVHLPVTRRWWSTDRGGWKTRTLDYSGGDALRWKLLTSPLQVSSMRLDGRDGRSETNQFLYGLNLLSS